MPNVDTESNMLIQAFIVDTLAKDFVPDPAVGEALSRVVSVVGSLIKKDGFIIQHAIERALRDSEHLEVWQEPRFQISAAADQIASEARTETCLETDLPYGRDTTRHISCDLVVLDRRSELISVYDVKRGHGAIDSVKRRQILRDVLCARMLLKSYSRQLGHDVTSADAKIISIYGRTGLPDEITVRGDQLDRHFRANIERPVFATAAHFRQELARILPDLGLGQP